MRPLFPIVAILFIGLATTISPVAEGHGTGSPVVGASGSFLLAPAGTQNDTFHAFLSDFGLPIGSGDSLQFSWESNNGSGPPVYFEIHAHPATTGYVLYYRATNRSIAGTWTVPGSEPYMVYWQNLNQNLTNVSYAFALYPPELWFPLIVAITLIPVWAILAVIAVVWLKSRRKKRETRPNP